MERIDSISRWRLLPAALALLSWLSSLWLQSQGGEFPDYVPLWAIAWLLGAVACARSISLGSGGAMASAATAVALIGLLPRVSWLGSRPYLVSLDEALFALDGLNVLRDRPWAAIHGIDTPAIPYLGETLQALPALWLEPLWAIRLGSTVQGMLAIWFTYLLARRLYGPQAALFAVVFLACSFWHMVYSSLGLPMMQPVLAAVVVTYLLVRGEQEDHPLLLYLGGSLLGASLLLYTPSRIALGLALAWWGHRLWTAPGERPRHLRQTAIVAIGALLFLSPHLAEHGLAVAFERFAEVLATNTANGGMRPISLAWLTEHVSRAVGIYVRGHIQVMADGYTQPAVLDPVSLALAAIGIGIALRGSRESRFFLLWAWVAEVFLFGQLMTDLPDSAYRAAPVLPALAMAVGLALDSGLRWFPRHRWRLLVLGLYVVCALPTNLRALQRFFLDYDTGSRAARLFGQGSRDAVYFVMSSSGRELDPIYLLAANRREAYPLPSLADFLARPLPGGREIVILIEPELSGAAEAILRCYPGAQITSENGSRNGPALALRLRVEATADANGCTPAEGTGIRARYFAGTDEPSGLIRERVEAWPTRFRQETELYRLIEWDGDLDLGVGGIYRFMLTTSLATAGLSVGGQMIPPGAPVPMRLTAGRIAVKFECRPTSPEGFCLMLWQPPGGELTPVPPSVWRQPAG